MAWTAEGIAALQLPERDDAAARARIRGRFADAIERAPEGNARRAIDQVAAHLSGKLRDLGSIQLDLRGVPPFHARVYQALRLVPPGATIGYGALAARVGQPAAARAVGQAVGKNPFAIVVPCHRVLAAGGKAGGFSAHGGVETKRRLLAIEGVHLVLLWDLRCVFARSRRSRSGSVMYRPDRPMLAATRDGGRCLAAIARCDEPCGGLAATSRCRVSFARMTQDHEQLPAVELVPRFERIDALGAGTMPLFGASGGLGFDARSAVEHLSSRDDKMAELIERVGPMKLSVEATRSTFETLAESIVYQQLTGKAAATIHDRVRALFPRKRIAPRALLAEGDAKLRAAGLSRGKIAALRDLARRTIDGTVPRIDALHAMADDAIVDRLVHVHGIGRWTVEMLLIFRLGRPDVLPVGDYGVRHGFQLAYRKRALPTPGQLAKHGEKWRPFRTAASWYLWRAVDLARLAANVTSRRAT